MMVGVDTGRAARDGADLAAALGRVVADGNCTGCGLCAAIAPDAIGMALDESGFLRPQVLAGGTWEPDAASDFARSCPGLVQDLRTLPRPPRPHGDPPARGVTPSSPTRHEDPVFGPYLMAWVGWATDPDTRFSGASGGVLTALASWLTGRDGDEGGGSTSGRGEPSVSACARMDPRAPDRTVAVTLSDPRQVLGCAGSRYAPVGVAALAGRVGHDDVMVGKPCEVCAVRQWRGPAGAHTPLLLSFFCAGTPSQAATWELLERGGIDTERLVEVAYRGQGWPGTFRARDLGGTHMSLDYERSWGEVLGHRLQEACKTCPDGLGLFADVAVGDFWEADDAGFPLFGEAEGRSVVIARTPRGLRAVQDAQADGVLVLEGIDLAARAVHASQPFQVRRRRTLGARRWGKRMARASVPRLRGMVRWGWVVRHPRLALREARGTAHRTRRARQ